MKKRGTPRYSKTRKPSGGVGKHVHTALKETGTELFRLASSTNEYMNVHDRRMVRVRLVAIGEYLKQLATYLDPPVSEAGEYSDPDQHPF